MNLPRSQSVDGDTAGRDMPTSCPRLHIHASPLEELQLHSLSIAEYGPLDSSQPSAVLQSRSVGSRMPTSVQSRAAPAAGMFSSSIRFLSSR